MGNRKWTPEEIEFVKSHPAWTADKLARRLDRTACSIRQKAERYGIAIQKEYNVWSGDELKKFKNDWRDEKVSNRALRGRYKNRTMRGLREKARELGLGPRLGETVRESLTVRDIMTEMGVSKDRVYSWIKKGLKHKVFIDGQKRYLVSQKDLLEFLRTHPGLYDASRISDYLFPSEPEWLKAKRRTDRISYVRKSGKTYSDSELNSIIMLFKMGKSNAQIADAVGRTAPGVAKILDELGLSRHRYNDYETEILRANSPEKTVAELTKLLPLRGYHGIIRKCCELKIKYRTK